MKVFFLDLWQDLRYTVRTLSASRGFRCPPDARCAERQRRSPAMIIHRRRITAAIEHLRQGLAARIGSS